MKVYLASGFSLMNVENREREIFDKLVDDRESYNRLISFYDTITGNNIYQIIELAKEINKAERENSDIYPNYPTDSCLCLHGWFPDICCAGIYAGNIGDYGSHYRS